MTGVSDLATRPGTVLFDREAVRVILGEASQIRFDYSEITSLPITGRGALRHYVGRRMDGWSHLPEPA